MKDAFSRNNQNVLTPNKTVDGTISGVRLAAPIYPSYFSLSLLGFSFVEILPSILSSYFFSDRSSSPPAPPPPVDNNTQGQDAATARQIPEAEETEDEVAQINENAKQQSEIVNRIVEHDTESNKDMMKQCAGVLGDLERRTCANPNITLEEIEFKKASSFLHLQTCLKHSVLLFSLRKQCIITLR